MKSKKIATLLATLFMLSASGMTVSAHGLYGDGYGQGYDSYGNNGYYSQNYDSYNSSNNFSSYLNNITDSSTQDNSNNQLKSQIDSEKSQIDQTEQANSKISQQINRKENKIRNLSREVNRGKLTLTSDQTSQITTLSATLNTDLQTVNTDDVTVQQDIATVQKDERNRDYQSMLTGLTTEETDRQTKGTALTAVNTDLDNIITIIQGQPETTSTSNLAVQSVSAVDGTLIVTFNSPLATTPAVADFVVTQTTGTGVTTIIPTVVTMDSTNTVATITIPTVTPTSVEQSVVDTVSYENTTPVSANAFDVAAATTTNTSAVSGQTFNGVYSECLLGNTGLLGSIDDITVPAGTQVTGVTVNGNSVALGTDYSISGNVITVAVNADTDTVVIQTIGGINNPVTITNSTSTLQ